jgi:hypothetical protein
MEKYTVLATFEGCSEDPIDVTAMNLGSPPWRPGDIVVLNHNGTLIKYTVTAVDQDPAAETWILHDLVTAPLYGPHLKEGSAVVAVEDPEDGGPGARS